MPDPKRTDDHDRLRVSILVDRETWADFQGELIRQGIPTSEGPTSALRCWLETRGRRPLSLAKAARRAG